MRRVESIVEEPTSARATTEASLAILTSAREGRDIDLQWQVPWR
jgi:hypothetical protein